MSQTLEERIQSLLEQGKITAEDADRLRGASSAPAQPAQPSSWDSVSVVKEDTRAVGFQKTPDVPQSPPAPEAPEPPRAPREPERVKRHQNFKYTGPVRKVIVQSRAGNIEVTGGGRREVLEAESDGGDFEASEEDGVITIRNQLQLADFPKPLEWLKDPFKALRGVFPSNLELTLPEGVEVLEIQSVAGNIEISGVRARVILDVKAGNIELDEPKSFQIHTTAGNVEVSGCLTGGEKNSIHSTAGNVEVSLEHGSSVRVSASVQAGNLEIDGFSVLKREKRVVGESVEATLGSGAGSLEIRVQAGNLDLSGEE